MRNLTPLKALSAAAAIALLAGCSGSGSSAIAPKLASSQGSDSFLNALIGRNRVSHYSCPSTGSIKYVSDEVKNVINIYTGKFAGQGPCGQLSGNGIFSPSGMFVKVSTHDLYVANSGGNDVLVFHRGQTAPYNTYIDPSVQYVVDVTVAKDGTVIASNSSQPHGAEKGSISTWIEGPNGGTFIGNFAMTNDLFGAFITVQKNGTVYYDDIDASSLSGALWSLSCPAGACGAQTQVAGASIIYPGGMGSDNTEDLLVNDRRAVTADTFELPNPSPKTFPLAGEPVGMAINKLDHHWFVADVQNNNAAEYLYPSGILVGTVPGNAGGVFYGIAVDPGHALK